ncbi:MAG: PilZ domain-containing protein [Nitrospiraceae bacterium]
MTDRKSPRLQTQIRIFFTDGHIEGEGTVLDLSKDGCRVESETYLHTGVEVEAWIYPPDHDWPLKVESAVVRWSKDNVCGIEFIKMQPAQRERLRLVMNEKNLRSTC